MAILPKLPKNRMKLKEFTLLAFIALLAIQSSARTLIHSAIVFIDTFNNA